MFKSVFWRQIRNDSDRILRTTLDRNTSIPLFISLLTILREKIVNNCSSKFSKLVIFQQNSATVSIGLC
jgi:hypothetical protein